MSVTLLEVMAAAQARRAPLVAELAGYLVLGAADQSAGAPRQMRAADVVLAEDGSVRLVGAGTACASEAAERSLRKLLGQLMQVASSATPALLRSTQRPSGAGVDALIRELETALIPVNRAAARRSLSRLHRETARALASGQVDVAAFESGDPEVAEKVEAPAPRSPPDVEAVVAPAPPAPEPEVREWSVPIEILQTSPEPAQAEEEPGARSDAPRAMEEETAPETIVARARSGESDKIIELPSSVLEVVLELSPPPLPEVTVELSPPESIVTPKLEADVAAAPGTPVVGTFCDPSSVHIPVLDADVTDAAPPVFEHTQPLELPAEAGRKVDADADESAAGVEEVAAEPVEDVYDEDIEWVEVEPSVKPPPVFEDTQPLELPAEAQPRLDADADESAGGVEEVAAEPVEDVVDEDIECVEAEPVEDVVDEDIECVEAEPVEDVVDADNERVEAEPVEDVVDADNERVEAEAVEDVVDADIERVEAEPVEDVVDADNERVEAEPSQKPALCRSGEPFAVAPSAEPPGVAPRSQSAVIVFRGAPREDPEAGSPDPEPTPPLRIPGVEKTPSAPARFAPRQSDVTELLAAFAVAETRSEKELRGDLKRIAGLEPTPPPAEARGAETTDEGRAGAADPASCEAR